MENRQVKHAAFNVLRNSANFMEIFEDTDVLKEQVAKAIIENKKN